MAFANRPVRSQSQWKASIFLCRDGLVSMLGEVGNTQLAFSNNKYEIGHSRGKKSGRNVNVLVDWFLHFPLGRSPMPRLAWRLEKETFHQSVTCYCFHLFYCESTFNSFLKVKNEFDPVCVSVSGCFLNSKTWVQKALKLGQRSGV